MYTTQNFKSKKALREAVAAHSKGHGPAVTYFQPGPFGGNEPQTGVIYCEGPHYPEPHRWYAQCVVAAGIIVSVKG